ncbi:metalloprotease [Lithospermum erythrorhizon]|uniref:Metalloprotease n=1 Tax=Lithospermum erythrorhizon TaxID=34254 RepID=A0AAV3R517_LITER
MAEEKKKNHRGGKNLVVLSGGAAFLAVAVSFAVSAFNKRNKRKEVRGSNVLVNLSAAEILKLSEKIIAKSKEVHDAVASVQLDKVTYDNVVLPLAELEALQFPMIQSCIFPKMVSPFEDLRKASAEAERKIDAHVSTCSNRDDVYRVVKAFALKGESMTPEAKHFTDVLVHDFERNGLWLTTTKRDELQRLKSQIDELSMLYIKNLNEDNTYIICSEIELAGLPLEFINSLDNFEKGKFKIMLKSHHVSPILEHCKVGSTRRKVAVAYGRRCESNVSVFEKMIQVRHKIAILLDYESFGDYATNIRMGKSCYKVIEFLQDMSHGLTELAYKELSMLKELKRKEEGESLFGIEDLPYYVKRIQEQELDLDFGVLKEYFPVNLVLSGIFKICEDLFGNYAILSCSLFPGLLSYM